jgi:hypothetical protein
MERWTDAVEIGSCLEVLVNYTSKSEVVNHREEQIYC